MNGHGARCQDTDRPIPDLPSVAVWAMQHVTPPALPDPRNVRQLVDEPGGDQQPPGADPAAVLQRHGEAAVDRLGRGDASVENAHAIAANLLPSSLEQRGRGHAVPGEEPVDPGGGRVAGLARVDDQHRPPGPAEHQCAAEAGGATTDHHDIVRCEIMGVRHLHFVLLLPEFSVPYHSTRFSREVKPPVAVRFLADQTPSRSAGFPNPRWSSLNGWGRPGDPPAWVHGTHETIRTSASSSEKTSKRCRSLASKKAASPGSRTVRSFPRVSLSLPLSMYSHSWPPCSWSWCSVSTRSAGKTTFTAVSPSGPASGISG